MRKCCDRCDPGRKIFPSLERISALCDKKRAKGEGIVLSCGLFDTCIEDEYLYSLRTAAWGRTLIMGVLSDASREGRYAQRSEAARLSHVAALDPVSYVVLFEHYYQLVEAVRPHVYLTAERHDELIRKDRVHVALLHYTGAEIQQGTFP